MAKVLVTHVKKLQHPSTQIEGCKTVSWELGTFEKSTASDGEPPVTDPISVTLSGEALFDNSAAVAQALANAEGNLVVTAPKKGQTADRVYTLKNIKFLSAGSQHPNAPEQRMSEFRLRFRGSPGAADTTATMVTEA